MSVSSAGERATDASSIFAEYRPVAGLLLGYCLLVVGNGLFQTLIPLRMLHAGASTFAVGLIQSCYYLGYLLGAVVARRLIDRMGQPRVFIAFSATAAVLALAFGMSASPVTQAIVRLLTGIAFMGLYSSIESWLNGAVSNGRRGRMFASYTAINYLGLSSGQFLLNIDDPAGAKRFGIAAALFAAAVIPVSLFEGWPAKLADHTPRSGGIGDWNACLHTMARAAPLAIPGCVLTGVLYSTFFSMAPVFLARSGFATGELSAFMGLCLIGALVTQWPSGQLSDYIDRRRLVFTNASLSLTFSIVLAIFQEHAVIWIATIAYVAVTFTQYALIVSYTNDRTEPQFRVAVSSALLALFSVGGMTGPAIASAFMAMLGPRGLFVFNALSSALLALVARHALYRPGKTLPYRAVSTDS